MSSDEEVIGAGFICNPCPSEWLTAVEVSPLVNSAKNNSPEVLQPAGADEAARTPQRRLFEV